MAKKTVRKENINPAAKPEPEKPNYYSVKLPKQTTRIFVGLVVILIIILAYYFRGTFIAAIVNGQPITRFELTNTLDQQFGKQTLNSLITKTLILQEAKKENVTVSDSEVNNQIKAIQASLSKNGQNLLQVLALQGMTKQDLIENIRIQKLIDKMIGKNITVTDKEVNDYIKKNKASIPANEKPSDVKTKVKQQLTQQKLSGKYQTWIANLQKNAKINYFVSF